MFAVEIIEKLNYPHIGIFIFAWFIADLITALLIKFAPYIDALDKPHSYKSHSQPTPFLGGIGIYFAFSIAMFSILRFTTIEANQPIFVIMFGSIFIIIIGCLDGYIRINAVIKLLILILSAAILSKFDVVVNYFQKDFLFQGSGEIANLLITVIWLAGLTSAMNSLDNMDGVCAGVTAIAAFFTFLIAWFNYSVGEEGIWNEYQKWVSFASIGVTGACLGFLRYNFTPAKIFLGDNGSFFLGFVMGSICVLGGWSKDDPLKSFIIPCAIFAVPLYDIVISTILRLKNKVVKNLYDAIVYCGRDHISHRLVKFGLSKRETALMLYLGSTLSGSFAFLISKPDTSKTFYLILTGIAIFILVVIGFVLDKAKVYEE